MMAYRNGRVTASPPAHPDYDLEPLSSQQVWERLEAELTTGLGLEEPGLSNGDACAAGHRLPQEPDDDLAREFRTIREEVLGTISALKLRLMDMVQQEFHKVYQEVLAVSRQMDLPFVSAANLVADGLSPDTGPSTEQGAASPAEMEQTAPQHVPIEASTAVPAPVQPQPQSVPPPKRVQILGTAMSPGAAQKEIFEGTVRLSVKANGNVRQLLQFVGTLSKRPELRLLRLLGDQGWVDLWVGLRQPLTLYAELEKMEGVARVANVWELDGEEKERRIELWLREESPPDADAPAERTAEESA